MMSSITSRPIKLLFVLAVVALAVGCAAMEKTSQPAPVPEIRPGILAGYLPVEALPNSLAMIPPPPAQGSAAAALDEAVSRRNLELKGSPRWALATRDAELMFPKAAEAFSCAVGFPISKETTPYLYMILRRTLADAGLSTYAAKNRYQRKRPFIVNGQPICTPDEAKHLMKDGSYPSGHTAIGWAWALILAELVPDRADAILSRGRAFGESRNVCNVHWHSDVVEGRFMGASTVARLHADPTFLSDMAAAKKEIKAARTKGLKPVVNCEAEASALK